MATRAFVYHQDLETARMVARALVAAKPMLQRLMRDPRTSEGDSVFTAIYRHIEDATAEAAVGVKTLEDALTEAQARDRRRVWPA